MLQPETYRAQRNLAVYCRTGKLAAIPGINKTHARHYRRLVFNVIRETLENAFPLTARFLPAGEWEKLVESFFSHHPCHSAQVFRLPGEFCEYVKAQEKNLTKKYPFLNDLLYFEWIEIDLHLMPDLEYPACREKGDWLRDAVACNPECRLVSFQYPVHLYPPELAKDRPGNYFLLLFREQESGDIRFINISVLFAFIIEQVVQRGATLEKILDGAAETFKITDRELLTENTLSFLQELKKEQFILGFEP